MNGTSYNFLTGQHAMQKPHMWLWKNSTVFSRHVWAICGVARISREEAWAPGLWVYADVRFFTTSSPPSLPSFNSANIIAYKYYAAASSGNKNDVLSPRFSNSGIATSIVAIVVYRPLRFFAICRSCNIKAGNIRPINYEYRLMLIDRLTLMQTHGGW